MKPLISIALATYNGGRFLREQLDSIYAQTWRPIDVVACDDRSSDDTVAILEEYRQRHGLRYEVNERNLGFVRNFEKVMALCRGEFIALADQDDVWLPEKLERLMAGIGDASLVYSDAFLIDDEGRELPGSLIATSGVLPVTGRKFQLFRLQFLCHRLHGAVPARPAGYGAADSGVRNLPRLVAGAGGDQAGGVMVSSRTTRQVPAACRQQHRRQQENRSGESPPAAHLRGGNGKRLKGQYYRLVRDRGAILPAMKERLALTDDETVVSS